MFDSGTIKLRYLANTTYPYGGAHLLSDARDDLNDMVKRRDECVVDWFKLSGWVFQCPSYTIGQKIQAIMVALSASTLFVLRTHLNA